MRRARKARKTLRRRTAPMVARDGARMHATTRGCPGSSWLFNTGSHADVAGFLVLRCFEVLCDALRSSARAQLRGSEVAARLRRFAGSRAAAGRLQQLPPRLGVRFRSPSIVSMAELRLAGPGRLPRRRVRRARRHPGRHERQRRDGGRRRRRRARRRTGAGAGEGLRPSGRHEGAPGEPRGEPCSRSR